FTIVEVVLQVGLSPDLTTPEPYVLCEATIGDGTAVFNLPSKEEEMLDGADPDLFDFYYYEEEAEAIAAGEAARTNPNYTRAIGNPATYTNLTNPQIIYVLAVGNANYTDPYNGGEGCYDIVELELVVDSLRSEEHTSELQSRFDLVCSL